MSADISLQVNDPMVHGRSSSIVNSIQHCLRIEFNHLPAAAEIFFTDS